jgi:hypothetical protein
MRKLLLIAAICFPFIISSPSTGQVRWGLDLRFGSPAPPMPYPEAVWEPGYYDYDGYRYVWFPGRWHRRGWVNPGHHYGWEGGRGHGDRGDRGGHGRGRGR